MALCGAVLSIVMPTVAAEEPIISRSLAQLEKAPPASPEAFDFVVTGDTHSNRQLVYQTDLFKGMIREWNILKPAFALEVGDLVLGGSANNVPPQWDLFAEDDRGMPRALSFGSRQPRHQRCLVRAPLARTHGTDLLRVFLRQHPFHYA